MKLSVRKIDKTDNFEVYIEAKTYFFQGTWFVYFSAIDPETGKMRRKRIYKGIEGNTYYEKERSAEKLAQFYTGKLAKGWNPWAIGKDVFFKHNKGIQINKLIDLYIKSRVLRHSSLNQYNSMNTIVTKWCKDQRINNCNQFTYSHAENFIKQLADRGKSASRRAGFISFMNSVFNFGLKKKLVFTNPFAELEKPKRNKKPALYINDNDAPHLTELLKQDKQLLMLCQWVYYCFIRPFAEMRMLQIRHINFSNQTITIPGDISKNKKTETLPIPVQMFNQLNDLKGIDPAFFIFGPGEKPGLSPVSKNHYQRRFKMLVEDTPYSRYTVYSFKHTGAIRLVKSGCSIKDIQMQMRHHSLDETDKYLRQMLATESDFLKNKFPELFF